MNRRPARSTAALATGCCTIRRPRFKLLLSTSSIHFSRLPIEQACERIAELGFEVDRSAYEGCPH
jgi:hypothetical protein